MTNLAIFASGNGSNAENIIRYFKKLNDNIVVKLIITNKPNAYVIQRAIKHNIDYKIFTKPHFQNPIDIIQTLTEYKINFIVLAGFLLLIPKEIIELYPKKILNIHPALLPKYGGKGMYGTNVHNAVLKNKEVESGITIHYVNEKYDEGQIIFQAKCPVFSTDTVESLEERIHVLEYLYYPQIIEKIVSNEFFR